MICYVIMGMSLLGFNMKSIIYNNIHTIHNINMDMKNVKCQDVSWERTDKCEDIINKYFRNMNENKYKNNDNEICGEMFKIFGYPGLLIIFNKDGNRVDEFIMNKNLILMFDASSIMRFEFYKKYKKINIDKAINKDIFLII